MSVSIREAQLTDAFECGRIIYAAFALVAAEHNFPSAEVPGTGNVTMPQIGEAEH